MSIFAIADLHGRYDLWAKVKCHLNQNDILFCLGDCIDRGPDGIKIVDEMRARPNTYYIKGNHEDMAAAALYDLHEIRDPNESGSLWFYNGGYPTYEALAQLSEKKQIEYAYYFNKLSLEYSYTNTSGETILLNHAGFTPGEERDLLWDRSSFHGLWPSEAKIKIIHGHTPVQYLEFHYGYDSFHPCAKNAKSTMSPEDAFDKWEPHAIWYCGGHKCDIDLGSAYSNKTMLLNLDTWEEIYFEVLENNYE